MALVKTKEVERRENNNFRSAKGNKEEEKASSPLLSSKEEEKRISFVLRLGRKIENFTPATKLGHELTLRERINLVNFRIDRCLPDRIENKLCSDAEEPSKRGRYLGYKARTRAPTVLTSCTYIRSIPFPYIYSTPTPGIRLEGSLKCALLEPDERVHNPTSTQTTRAKLDQFARLVG